MRDFIGHNDIIQNFMKRAENNNISHANLIIGEDGIGKSIIANIFAKRILAVVDDRDYIDIIKYKPNKASFGVDEVRNLIEEVHKKPYEGEKKVLIIYEANKLTIQAQNALLKTIEEPPVGVFIILLSDSAELLLDTIKSRCQIYKLFPITKEEVNKYITKQYPELADNDIKAAIGYSEGIPGKAEIFIENDDLKEIRKTVLDLLKKVNSLNVNDIIKFEKALSKFKDNGSDSFNLMVSLIRDVMIKKSCNGDDSIINSDKIDEIEYIASNTSYKKLNLILMKIEEARRTLRSNTNFETTIRVMLMGFMEG